MNKTLPTSLKALHIGVVREGRFIEDRWFKSGIDVTIGTGEKNTFAMPLSTLGKRQPLFVHKQGKPVLCFDEHARGKLTFSDGKDLALAECRKLASPRHGHFEIPVSDDMRGHLTFGEVSFVFNFSKPPPTPPRRLLPKEARGSMWNVTDQTFLMVLAISFAFHGCMIGAVSRRDLPPEDAVITAIDDNHIIHIEIPKQPEEKPKQDAKPLGEKPKQDLAKREPQKVEAFKDSVQHQRDVADAVRKLGLNVIFAKEDDGSAIGNVFKTDSFADIDKALQDNPKLSAIASTEPVKPKGADAARETKIGDLVTHDIGSAPRLHENRDIGPNLVKVPDRADVEIDSPSVDKNALTRFIQARVASIRTCYEQQLKRSPNLRGKIVMQFTITPRGTVSEASAAQDSMGSDEVTGCIVRQIKTWRFSFRPGADVTVSFPFIFSPAS